MAGEGGIMAGEAFFTIFELKSGIARRSPPGEKSVRRTVVKKKARRRSEAELWRA